jgi:glycine cleavage system H protein
MNFPADLLYTPDHEWIRFESDEIAVVGITDFAQNELGDIVYVDIESQGQVLAQNEIFGTVEAVKTVSDLFLPVSGTILEVNQGVKDSPELVNTDPYQAGWMIKVQLSKPAEKSALLDVDSYKKLIGQ